MKIDNIKEKELLKNHKGFEFFDSFLDIEFKTGDTIKIISLSDNERYIRLKGYSHYLKVIEKFNYRLARDCFNNLISHLEDMNINFKSQIGQLKIEVIEKKELLDER